MTTSESAIAGKTPDLSPARRRGLAGSGQAIAALVIFLALALLPVLAYAVNDPFILVTAVRAMILAIAALSLDLILGYGAMVSFGHAAFIGIGAYAVAILASHGITDFAVQLPVAIAASALFALVTGAISLRTKGVYFIMITLAFGQMAYFFMVSLSAYGGDDGISLDARSTLFGTQLFADNLAFFYTVLGLLVALFLLARRIIASRFGRVLTGIRENPVRMQAIGFSPFRYQLTAYVIAGAMAGVAGALLANQAEFVSPAYMTWQRSGELIVMVVIGGMGTLVGGVAGAAAFILLEEWLAHFSEHWQLWFGVLVVLIVIFTRGGLVGLVRRMSGGGRS